MTAPPNWLNPVRRNKRSFCPQWLDAHRSRYVQISVQRLKSELFFAPEPKNEKAKALKLPVSQVLEDIFRIFKRSTGREIEPPASHFLPN